MKYLIWVNVRVPVCVSASERRVARIKAIDKVIDLSKDTLKFREACDEALEQLRSGEGQSYPQDFTEIVEETK